MNSVASAFSTNYDSIEDSSSLENSLNSKFSSMSTITLRHRVDRVSIAGQEGRVLFYWDADPNTTTFTNYGTFIFTKDTDWKLLSVSDDNTFLRYTSQAGSVSVAAGKTTLIANETDNTAITVTAKDSAGQPVRDGSVVNFSATLGSFSQQTASTVNGIASVTYTAGAVPGAAVITAETGGVSNSINVTIQPEHAPLPPN